MHPLPAAWDLYLHTAAVGTNYGASFRHTMHVATCEDWGHMWNHSHPDLVGSTATSLRLAAKDPRGSDVVTGWSFFRHFCRPEWEHPANHDGSTVTARANPPDATKVWQSLVLDCTRGAAPPTVLGVQVTRKWSRGGTLVLKWDVWLARDASHTAVVNWLRDVTKLHFEHAPRR